LRTAPHTYRTLVQGEARPSAAYRQRPDLPMSAHTCHGVGVNYEDFREPWFRLEPEYARAFEREAEKEIAPGHELHGLALSALAKCEGCDDVVFRASDDTFAIVHLAWTLKPETPPWPQTRRLGSFIAVETVMDQHAH